jgi:prepilin-type N-terminal cleavage/methylation domain-containing protein
MNIIKTNRRARQSGTTLIELSVVIAVILLLASVLFLGVQGWKAAADRSAAIVSISSIQKAVRGFQNTNLLNVGAGCDSANDIAPYFNGTLPTDPSNGGAVFTYGTTVPALGALYASSGNAATMTQLGNIGHANW